MKLWLLRPIENLKNDPWSPVYSKMVGFVVRAETELEAREFADKEAELENENRNPWLDPELSTCIELKQDGEPGVVIFEFAA